MRWQIFLLQPIFCCPSLYNRQLLLKWEDLCFFASIFISTPLWTIQVTKSVLLKLNLQLKAIEMFGKNIPLKGLYFDVSLAFPLSSAMIEQCLEILAYRKIFKAHRQINRF